MAHNELTASEPGSIGDTVARLISWSRRHSWGLARVEYVSELARERVLSSLRYALAEELIPFHEIELPSYRSASEIVRFLIDQLGKIESGVASISGFAIAFPTETPLEDSLRVLNFNRENLVLSSLRQIWWLPSSFAQTFVPAVPDLDSWFTIRLYLTQSARSPSAQSVDSDYEEQWLDRISNIPLSNKLFIGRDSALEAIQSELETGGTVVIYGPAGVGKTQTAFEYARRHRDEYKALFWTLAEDEDSLRTGLFKIAMLLDLPELRQVDQSIAVEAARHWLQGNDKWLLVLDELTDLGGIVPPIVSAGRKRHVLVTSRRIRPPSGPAVALSTMTAEESRTLLLQRAGREPASKKDAMAADDLVRELGYVPLALELAGAYIQKEEIDYETYLAFYKDHSRKSQLTNREPFPSLSAIDLSFDRLNKPSCDFLILCSFFNPDEIPFELVRQSFEVLLESDQDAAEGDSKEAQEIMRMIDRYALLRADVFSRVYSMHRIVQAAIRNHIGQDEQREWAESAVGVVNSLFSNPNNDWAKMHRLLSSALAAAELIENLRLSSTQALELLVSLGVYFSQLVQYARAEPLLRHALKLASEFHLSGVSTEIRILCVLANLYAEEGRHEEAKGLLNRVLNRLEESGIDPKHPFVADVLSALAKANLTTKNFQEAESLLRRTLQIQLDADRRDSSDIIATLNYLAFAYMGQERFADAERSFEMALQFGDPVLGPKDRNIRQTLKGLGRMYIRQEKYEEAKHIYEFLSTYLLSQVEIAEDVEPLVDLGFIYLREGSYAEAESVLLRALNALPSSRRADSEAARLFTYLAYAYMSRGRYEDAERSVKDALAIQEPLLGPGHLDVAESLRILAMILRSTGRQEEAVGVEKRAARIASLGQSSDPHPNTQ